MFGLRSVLEIISMDSSRLERLLCTRGAWFFPYQMHGTFVWHPDDLTEQHIQRGRCLCLVPIMGSIDPLAPKSAIAFIVGCERE